MPKPTKEMNFKKENLIVDTLFKHRGIENTITAKELCDILRKNGFEVKHRSINGMMTKIKFERKIPLCYIRGKGYFWGRKKKKLL